jgi:hypothetical protein
MTTDQPPVTLEALAALVASQANELAQLKAANAVLQDEVAALRSAQGAASKPTGGRTKRQGSPRTSRRKLLQLGGAAAAATVAAGVLTTESGAAHAASARADGATITYTASGSGNVAIEGDGTSGAVGVQGTSDTFTGVLGTSTHGTGVIGTSTSGFGVYGGSVGIAISGVSESGYGGYFQGGKAPLCLVTPLPASYGPPSPVDRFVGEIYVDSSGALFVFTTTSFTAPGTWQRLAPVAATVPGGAMNFLPGIARVVTSGNTSDPGVSLAVGSPQTFQIAGHGGIPANATGVFGNATVYGSSGTGFIAVYPAGTGSSGGSLNFVASDEPLSNFVATGLSTGGQITVATFSAGCKFIYDAVGYTL